MIAASLAAVRSSMNRARAGQLANPAAESDRRILRRSRNREIKLA